MRRLGWGPLEKDLLSRHLADGPPVPCGRASATLRAAAATAPPAPPTVRQVTGWLTRHPATLSEEERAALKSVLARCPELDAAAGHVRDFGEILTSRLGHTLPAWIDAVDVSQLPGLTNFALHLLRDLDAVTAGPHPPLELRQRRGRREPHQEDQEAALQTGRIRTAPQDDPAPVTLRSYSSRFVPRPRSREQSQLSWSVSCEVGRSRALWCGDAEDQLRPELR